MNIFNHSTRLWRSFSQTNILVSINSINNQCCNNLFLFLFVVLGDTLLVCANGHLTDNKLAVGLLFPCLLTSDIFALPIENVLLVPDYTMEVNKQNWCTMPLT